MKLEEFVKQKVDNHEFAYDEDSWTQFEKQLSNVSPRAKSHRGLKISASVAVVLVVVIASYFLINSDEIKQTNIVTNVKNVFQQEGIIANATTQQEEVVEKSNLHVNCLEKNNEIVNSVSSIKNADKLTINDEISSANVPIKKACENNQPLKSGICNNAIPSADFTTNLTEGCQPLQVKFFPCEKSDSVIFLWNFGDGTSSTERTPSHIYKDNGEFTAMLTVKYYTSSKLNTMLSEKSIIVKSTPEIDFEYLTDNNNTYKFNNLSENYSRLEWTLGVSEISADENIEKQFTKTGKYPVKLTAFNENGCTNTKTKSINVDIKHDYFVPNVFVPNGDGRNENFGPIGENLEQYEYKLYIYNKFGELIYETNDVNKPWDGKIQGTNQYADFGVYAWIIVTKDKFDNTNKKQGSVTLLKN
ncbi:MAG: hypothetical protein A2265_01815 [Bacteroidetes bacterium RIFOXYA12_FULL_33_9]|nr:MAG: hypothetical protein A2265_01815 [Bacteroidetes bacterium RIFOXYA12_FULL_33_9]